MFMLLIQANLQALSPRDLARFRNDKSGRQSPSSPPEHRYWATLHHIMTAHLSRASQANSLAMKFQRELASQLAQRFPLGEWTPTRPYGGFAKTEMALAATTTMVGERFLQVNSPEKFLNALWEFDRVAASIVWGLPRWLNRKAYEKRDCYIGMLEKWLRETKGKGWEESDKDWEPLMGSRYARELVKYFRKMGFEERSIAGAMSNLVVFA